jgi:predicted nucleic acid-binding protein
MIRIFLDSSVFFSAAYSSKGHSRDLLLMAAREEITLVISRLVLEETKRNLAKSAPQQVVYLDLIVNAISIEYVRPTKREVVAATKYVELKDAPIVAAAKKAKVDLLVTLDKKHLLDKPELVKYLGVPVVTPKEAVAHVREIN